ncbi:MAG TPA: efflux RND transporter periplasmic adaptor subunit, partial [Candidatus Acidoferrum sp.]|nr:efflux RND transporter periplasmic adaptor subunit [Candidatus Acidoferrum sp.]
MKLFCQRTCGARLLLALLLLVFTGCEKLDKPVRSDDSTSVARDGNRVIVSPKSPLASRLQVEPAKTTTIRRQVTAPASVEADPARYAKILPPLNGRVLQLFVHPGDSVTKGQQLLAIDAPDFVGAQTDYAKARSVLAQAERALTRQEDLATHGIIGQRDVDQARTDRDTALSDFNRTKDRLRLLGMDPENTQLGAPLIVRSPVSGKVLDVLTATGEFRNDPTAPLMTVADLSDIWVTANVQEKDIHYVHRGDPAIATFAAYPTEAFQGKVLFVADVLDPDTRTAKVRIAYPNKDGRLRPAMFANVILRTWDTQELTIPTTALVMSGDHTTVFVQVAENTYEQRPVMTGEQQGDRTIIKSGVQAGDKVLIREGALL